MRLLIAADMEGISGVVSLEHHVNLEHAEYQRFRRIMTQDVNAAIRGAAEAGVEEIVVTDGHWNNTNILIEELDSRARLNSGSPSPFSMVQGVDTGIDAAMFIGYHARMGTANAVLDHTWSSARIANLWLNGRISGETGLNAAVCGAYGVPVLLISRRPGGLCGGEEWIAGITTVQVKRATGRHSAECLPVAEAQRRIQDGAAQAVRAFQSGRAPAPLQISTPVTVGIEFIYSDMADKAILYPGAARDGRRVDLSAANMPSAYRAFRAAVALAQR